MVLLAVLLVLSMSIFLRKEKNISAVYQSILGNVVILNNATDRLSDAQNELELYLSQSATRNVDIYNQRMYELYSQINSLPTVFSTDAEQIAYNNIRNMVISLSQHANASIRACRGRDMAAGAMEFAETRRIEESIKNSINFLVFEYMTESEELYRQLVLYGTTTRRMTVYMVALITLLSVVVTILLLRNITNSLTILTKQSAMIANSPEEEHYISIESDDEVGELARAFNTMAAQIRDYIARLNEKANVENELRNSELKNLNIQSMLRDAELNALQSQINPHFLFNTLNCIAQTAMFEDATETNTLIITVSNMLRYNLRMLDIPVSIGEEVENLERYNCIQRLRYGDRIQFVLDIKDDSLLTAKIPCLTIQPIVENSVIHGFEKSERGGEIRVEVFADEEDHAIVTISDNGEGMDEETLRRIQNLRADTESYKGHSTGIGIQNVIQRLTLFYGHNVFEISSSKGVGTTVRLTLPRLLDGEQAGNI